MTPGRGWASPVHEEIAGMVSQEAGLAFRGGFVDTAGSYIDRAMAAAGYGRPGDYLAALRRDEELLGSLVAYLTIGETYFFRDRAQWAFIEELLPELARTVPGPIRAWSAGCATGEEPYTLALVADRAGLGDRLRIVGTDVNRGRLAAAEEGVYRRWSFRGRPPPWIDAYFEPHGRGLRRLDPSIRARVDFRYLNLADPDGQGPAAFPVGQHIVLCRNVLIYFPPEGVERLAGVLLGSLARNGWLLLGASDPRVSRVAPCRSLLTPAGVVYRRPDAPEEPPGLVDTPTAPPPEPRPTWRPDYAAEPAPTPPPPDPVDAGAARGPRAAAEPRAEVAAAEVAPTGAEPAPEPDPRGLPASDPWGAAREAYGAGDYARAARLARAAADAGRGADAWALQVRAHANRGRVTEALAELRDALAREPTSPELHYLDALLLAQQGRNRASLDAARRAVYLDGSMIMAHVAMADAFRRTGERARALHGYRVARRLLDAVDPDAPVHAADGQSARRVRRAVDAQIAALEAAS